MERGLQECREGLASLQTPDKGQMSESAYQEHARGVEQAVEDLRSKMSEHEKKSNKGERQMPQKNRPRDSGVKTEASPDRDQRYERAPTTEYRRSKGRCEGGSLRF